VLGCRHGHGVALEALEALIFGGRAPAGPRRCSHGSRGSNIWWLSAGWATELLSKH
jgi:hypothetical protein